MLPQTTITNTMILDTLSAAGDYYERVNKIKTIIKFNILFIFLNLFELIIYYCNSCLLYLCTNYVFVIGMDQT